MSAEGVVLVVGACFMVAAFLLCWVGLRICDRAKVDLDRADIRLAEARRLLDLAERARRP